jgi:hypothetical protein
MNDNQNRYTIARQSYTATHDIHGALREIEPAQVMVKLESDGHRAAETVVDLAMENLGEIYTLVDRFSTGHIAVYAQENETREDLLADVLEQMQRFAAIETATA